MLAHISLLRKQGINLLPRLGKVVFAGDDFDPVFLEIERTQDLEFTALCIDRKIINLSRRLVLLQQALKRNRSHLVGLSRSSRLAMIVRHAIRINGRKLSLLHFIESKLSIRFFPHAVRLNGTGSVLLQILMPAPGGL